MPQYTVKDNASGKTVTFEWNGAEPPTDADMEDVFAAAGSQAPESQGNPYNVPKNYGEMSRDEKIDWHMNDPLTTGAATGGFSPGTLVPKVIHGIAKTVMGKALGSQVPVQRAFPNVDLAEEALKHGTNPSKLAGAGKQAAKDVVGAGRAADAAGVPPVKAREIVSGLRPVFERAKQAELGGIAGAKQRVIDTAQSIRRSMPKEGLPIKDSLVAKSEWQEVGKQAQRAAPGELKGPNARIAKAVGGQFAGTIRGRGFEPLNQALDKSQSLMALQRAAQSMSYRPSLLQMIIGGAGGGLTAATTGDWKKAAMAAAVPIAMSPRGLSAMARGVDASSPATQPALEAILRSLLVVGSPGATGQE
jgi:hypothetical protein